MISLTYFCSFVASLRESVVDSTTTGTVISEVRSSSSLMSLVCPGRWLTAAMLVFGYHLRQLTITREVLSCLPNFNLS
jgi:hypothetical protein